MRISPEAIYQALYVQGRGALKRELSACLRSGRAIRLPLPREVARNLGKAFLTDALMISERPADVGIGPSQVTERATSFSASAARQSARWSSARPASRCCCICHAWTATQKASTSRMVRRLPGMALKLLAVPSQGQACIFPSNFGAH